jgi:parallel beta-helix repeat protein
MQRFLHLVLVSCLAFPEVADAIVFKSVKDYGARGDGVTDDTSAFNKCLADNDVCWVDSGLFRVGNVKLKNGNRLQGLAPPTYAPGDTPTKMRPILFAKSGSAAVLNVTAVNGGAAIVGLGVNCGSSSIVGITNGSGDLLIENVSVVDCGVGLGGSFPPPGGKTSQYTATAHIYNSTFGNNDYGIGDMVDSIVVNSVFIANRLAGMSLGPGANANTISNSRFEWNLGYGISVGDTNGNSIANCFIDRNYKAGIALLDTEGITISGSTFYRNGRNNAGPDANSQIFLSGAKNISITGGISQSGGDDSPGGPVTPAVIFGYDSKPSSYVTITGMVTGGRYNARTNRLGGYVSRVVLNDAFPTGWTVVGVTP